jgi:site-specific DNA-methyltransferase (adenine-specific)
MGYSDQFFRSLDVDPSSKSEIGKLSKKTGIPVARLRYYNEGNIVPSASDMTRIETTVGVYELDLSVRMGRLDHATTELLQEHASEILEIIGHHRRHSHEPLLEDLLPVFKTDYGQLYQEDCLSALKTVDNDSVDLVFADPPFNLDKLYPSKMNDNLKVEEYLKWTEAWLRECIRTLKPGGALFTWNLPVWNSQVSNFLHSRLTFKHWIATDIKYSLPIKGRLYPSHYSLLYFVKGQKANKLEADRLPTPTCPNCFGDLKDYGGYKHKMNPEGVSLTDIWTDIPPVRHAKYKKRKGANELSVKLMDRVIEMASQPGDLVLDPFGGSGTTYVVAELKGRRWWGCELGPCDIIVDRFERISEDKAHLEKIRADLNHLFPPRVKIERERRGLWTAESVAHKNKSTNDVAEELTLFNDGDL